MNSTPAVLRRARLALGYYERVSDVRHWVRTSGGWALPVKIDVGSVPDESLIPSESWWHFIVTDDYPLGTIMVSPSNDGGIKHTFQHQFRNRHQESFPYWSGNICTGNPFHVTVSSGESYDPNTRLRNYAEWTYKWVLGASHGHFVEEGQRFELPDYGVSDQATFVAHLEDFRTFEVWNSIKDSFGQAVISSSTFNADTLLVTSFQNRKGIPFLEVPWREDLAKADGDVVAAWLRVQVPPVLPPFFAPVTWGELEDALQLHNAQSCRSLDQVRRLARTTNSLVLLLGYPIPERYGENPVIMDWQAIKLPSFGDSLKQPKGYRNNRDSLALSDKARNFHYSATINYRKTSNWSPDAIQTRGRVTKDLQDMKVLLVGAGSLGSIVAEGLVRGGLKHLHILDDDSLQVGNLVRHTLLAPDLEKGKSTRLAERLNLANIHATVSSSQSKLALNQDINRFDAIVDTTGDSQVLEILGSLRSDRPIHYFIFSVSLGAKHLFCHHQFSVDFDPESFSSTIGELSTKIYAEFPESEIPLEYIGCWHPVFPARMDQMMLLGSLTIPEMERQLKNPISKESSVSSCVFEVEEDGHGVTGVKRREIPFKPISP